MRERLEHFLKSEKLTSTRFAEIMNVQPSSISHILGGRNKPSFDFIEKILDRFPHLNPDWLILGKGEMLRPNSSDVGLTNNPIHENNTADMTLRENTLFKDTDSDKPFKNIDLKNPLYQNHDNLKRIIFIYDDGTFLAFNPRDDF